MNRHSLIGIALLICARVCCNTAVAADEELLGIVAQKLGSADNPGVAPYLDKTSAPDSSMPNAQNLKKLSAVGLTFAGRAKQDGDEFNTVSYWADDSQLKPAVAEATFKAIASKLEEKHGPAKAAEVPNYEDAFTGGTRVFRWNVADEVILLSIHVHPPRASLSLQRIKQVAWLADMGASESEFWKATLRRDGEQPQLEVPETRNSVPAQPLQTPAALNTPTPTAAWHASASPTISIAPTPALLVERRAVVWPWLVAILPLAIIAALIWRRRT
jgi:hypothetical protein